MITLKGRQTIVMAKNTKYKEEGASAKDKGGHDLSSKIKVDDSNLNTRKVGHYSIRYSVQDDKGLVGSAVRDIHVVPLYFDMENNEKNDWKVWYGEASVTNIFDENRDSKVIFLNGNERTSGFMLGGRWNDKESKIVSWKMSTNENFVVRLIVNTAYGERYLEYHPKDTGRGTYEYGSTHLIIHGIGSNTTDEEWHTFTRDIEADIKRYEPNNSLIAVNGMFFRGKAKLDDIVFYVSVEGLKINKSVAVEAPGVVLTFDDSYIDGWYSMDQFFRENGAVATWFCYRWGSVETSSLNKEEIQKLKILESHGDEVGLHTVDHISTRDNRFNRFKTIDEKAQAYMDQQIVPGITNMRKHGFEPESFSYPYLSGQQVHNQKIREEIPHIRDFFARVIEIDNPPKGKSLDQIKKHLDKFKKEKEIGVFFAHWVLDKDFEPTNERYTYRISTQKLKEIIKYANKIGLKFYTLKEAHNIYLHQ